MAKGGTVALYVDADVVDGRGGGRADPVRVDLTARDGDVTLATGPFVTTSLM